MRTPRLDLAVQYAVPRRGVPATASFRQWALAVLSAEQTDGAYEVALRLVDVAEGRALNRDFRGRDYPTNVLSFPPARLPGPRPPRGRPRHLGDLVICPPVVIAEAAAQHKFVRDHYAHLTVHGVLHLLGHDHLDDTEATAMEALETRILSGLGIADPYQVR